MLLREYFVGGLHIEPGKAGEIERVDQFVRQCRSEQGDTEKKLKLGVRSKAVYRGADVTARGYRNSFRCKPQTQQTASGRVRQALIRAYPQFDHATISAIVRRLMKQARFIRLCRDSSNTHLAFSPDGCGANDMKRRRSLTFAKFLRRKCGDMLKGRLAMTDSVVDAASVAFQLVQTVASKLEIVSGEAAYLVYADPNGIRSCMADASDKGNSDIVKHHFCANGDKNGKVGSAKLRLVIARDAGKGDELAVRAKLWSNDDGSFWLDRVYWRCDGVDLGTMKSESELREWILDWLVSQGIDNVVSQLDCTLTHVVGESMPFCDRCNKFDRIGDTVRFHIDGECSADNTDGTDESTGEGANFDCYCAGCECGIRYDDDDYQTSDCGDTYCQSCHDNRFSYDDLSDCYIDNDDICQAYRIRRDCTEEVFTHLDNCTELYNGDFGVDDDTVELHDGEHAMRNDEDLVELHDGQYAISGRADIASLYNGDYALSDDTCHTEHGMALNDDCVEVDVDGYGWSYALADDCEAVTDDYGNVVYVIAREVCEAVE